MNRIFALLLVTMLAGCSGGNNDALNAKIKEISDGMVSTCNFLATVDSVRDMIAASGGPGAVIGNQLVEAVCSVVSAHSLTAGEQKTLTVIINGKEVKVEGTLVK